MKEFADFLSGQPPFDALDAEDLARLTARVEVEYFASGEVVVAEDVQRLAHLWVVRTGALEVLDRGWSSTCSVRATRSGPLAAVGPATAAARPPQEESLCLRIPDPRTFLAHPERLLFTANAVSPPRRLGVLAEVKRGLVAGFGSPCRSGGTVHRPNN